MQGGQPQNPPDGGADGLSASINDGNNPPSGHQDGDGGAHLGAAFPVPPNQHVVPVSTQGLDDQDRHLNYYTPLVDIFQRPALPSLNGPFLLAGAASVAWLAPGRMIQNYAMTQALYYSHRTVRSSIYHIMGKFCTWSSYAIGDVMLKIPSWTTAILAGTISDKLHGTGQDFLRKAANIAAPHIMTKAQKITQVCGALNIIAKPLLACAATWALYVLARHAIEPPPYEAPPGTYPNGGPIIEITQEEARNKAMVFTCPAPLARTVQERVLMCERDPTLIQKVKSIAAKWCDNNNITGNARYQAISGAVAASLTVPCIEQNVIELATSHAVQQQYGRLQRYLAGIKHRSDPWWSKYLIIRR